MAVFSCEVFATCVEESCALCNSETLVLVSVGAALRLSADSAGTMQAAVLLGWTAVNLSNISAASSACTLSHRQPPLTGDLNVYVYWTTPTNQFSTTWSHPAPTPAFIMYFVACVLYTHDAKFKSHIFLFIIQYCNIFNIK